MSWLGAGLCIGGLWAGSWARCPLQLSAAPALSPAGWGPLCRGLCPGALVIPSPAKLLWEGGWEQQRPLSESDHPIPQVIRDVINVHMEELGSHWQDQQEEDAGR